MTKVWRLQAFNFSDQVLETLREQRRPSVVFSAVNIMPEQPAKTEAGKNRHSIKILIVDDMEMLLDVVKDKLEPFGFEMDTAGSGAEAIEKVKQNEYDLVFMDHMMPVMDGIEATAQIRAWEAGHGSDAKKQIPVIVLTGNEIADKRDMYLASGFNDCLKKPIITAELEAILKNWLPAEKYLSNK